MKVLLTASLTDENEIAGRIDSASFSILKGVSASKEKGTWFNIRNDLLPSEQKKPEPLPPRQKIDPRNMFFGPSPVEANAPPLWSEEMRPKRGNEALFHRELARIGNPKTFTQFLDVLRGQDSLADARGEPEQAEAGRQAVFQVLALLDIHEDQLATVLSANEDRILRFRERAHMENRVDGRTSIRIPNWILDAQVRKPISVTAPRCFLHQGDLFIALVLYRKQLFSVSTPYVEPSSAQEASLLVKKAVYAQENRLKRLKQQVAAMERATLMKKRRETIPDFVKELVYARDGGLCIRCGSSESLHYDHIIPVAKGGGNTESNIQILCEHCNLQKSDNISF